MPLQWSKTCKYEHGLLKWKGSPYHECGQNIAHTTNHENYISTIKVSTENNTYLLSLKTSDDTKIVTYFIFVHLNLF